MLKEDGSLAEYHGNYRYALARLPGQGRQPARHDRLQRRDLLRHAKSSANSIRSGPAGTLYKDAIYQHLGKRYMSMDLDLEKKLCRVEPVDVDYYTEAVWESRVALTESLDQRPSCSGAALDFGYVNVNRQPKLYKKIRERTLENIGYGPITLDPFIYDTTGFSLHPPEAWRDAVAQVDKRHVGAALYGLSYILQTDRPQPLPGRHRRTLRPTSP